MGNDCTTQSPKSNLNKSAFIQFKQEMPKFRGNFNFQLQSVYNKIENAARQFCLANDIDITYTLVVARLLAYNHHHYFAAFKSIPQESRERIVQNMSNLEVQLMDSLYTHLIIQQHRHLNPYETINNISCFKTPPKIRFSEIRTEQLRDSQELGFNLLLKSKVAVMIMVSGRQEMQEVTSKALQVLPMMGAPTRLQFMLSKLYQNLSKSKEKLTPIKQPIIITCNTMNESLIRKYFIHKQYFGFSQKYVKIIAIRSLPILDQFGKFCLTFECKTLMYPQGSAKCLDLLLDQSTHLRTFLKYCKSEYIHILACDNENECPGDPIFIGIANRFDRRILAKCAPANELYSYDKRYVCSQSRLHLLNIKELEYLNDLNLLRTAPVALNSIIFQVSWLQTLAKDYETELALSRRYHPKEVYCNYYDFVNDKPVIRAKCLVFQKDIRDYICTSEKAQLLQYDRAYVKQTSSSTKENLRL